ncbi:N-acetyl-D-glucosamine kinase [Psilocybe cubensis]|uniref:N-acetyl-D-glucosamine kinase n=2 Tax=Psilocybe cubensis TaxID=181762 RepID=A0ACB8HDB8_PSICU|nr:N-acetyl-D-glucosamine kinase [Psilocybe cubensis]KAH9485471.1 N-acetyl-D-glucosamine kinase [Psilocybe cubensis]
MSLYLCVDCGGSKTAVVICNPVGTIVGRATGGPSNIAYLTPQSFNKTVKAAVIAALQIALPDSPDVSLPVVGKSPFHAAWFGVSGADSPAAIARIAAPLSELLGLPLGPKLVIANDTHLLAAPIRMYSDVTHAVAVIAGTGSITVSFTEVDGKIEELGRVGGWGWILGDEGGGYDVGRQALRQILLANDKSSITGVPLPKSMLIDRVLEIFGATTVLEILTGVYLPDPPPGQTNPTGETNEHLEREKRISTLSPIVFEAAFKHHDPLAMDVVKATASHLVAQIALLLGDGVESSARTVKASESVISFGGSLVGVEAYRQLILTDLAQRGHVFKRSIVIDDAAAIGGTALAAAFTD